MTEPTEIRTIFDDALSAIAMATSRRGECSVSKGVARVKWPLRYAAVYLRNWSGANTEMELASTLRDQGSHRYYIRSSIFPGNKAPELDAHATIYGTIEELIAAVTADVDTLLSAHPES